MEKLQELLVWLKEERDRVRIKIQVESVCGFWGAASMYSAVMVELDTIIDLVVAMIETE